MHRTAKPTPWLLRSCLVSAMSLALLAATPPCADAAPPGAGTLPCALEMSGVLTGLPGYQGRPAGEPIPLRSAPDPAAPVIMQADGRGGFLRNGRLVCGAETGQPCVSLAFAGDGMGLPVYQVRGDWVELAAGPGGDALAPEAYCRRTWVQLQGAMKVIPLERLLGRGPGQTLARWDGQIWDHPGGTVRDSGYSGVTLLRLEEVVTVPSSLSPDTAPYLWVKVTLQRNRCRDDFEDLATGWIPAASEYNMMWVWTSPPC